MVGSGSSVLTTSTNLSKLEAYRFNRNVWHMVQADSSRLIFLLPRANCVLWEKLPELMSGVVSTTRKRISIVAMEDVIANLARDERCPERLRVYAEKLKRKYVV